jgi:hypothetical protein
LDSSAWEKPRTPNVAVLGVKNRIIQERLKIQISHKNTARVPPYPEESQLLFTLSERIKNSRFLRGLENPSSSLPKKKGIRKKERKPTSSTVDSWPVEESDGSSWHAGGGKGGSLLSC